MPVTAQPGLGAPPGSDAPRPPDTPVLSPRAELARLDCTTQSTRREVILFGSGTIRLRDGTKGLESIGLVQLAPDELGDYLRRFAGEDLARVQPVQKGPEGSWIERCELTFELPDQEKRVYEYGQFDSLPLNLSRALHIVQELAGKVVDLKHEERLPKDFEALSGDLLKRQDGALFRVVGFTADRKGVELRGDTIPLTLFLTPEDLRHQFVALIARERER